MLPEIESYLKDTFTPETTQLFSRSFSLFEDFLTEDYLGVYMGAMMDEEAIDKPPVQDRFIATLFEQITNILDLHEVKMNEEASLCDYVDTLDFLHQLQTWEDKEQINQIIQAAVSPVDAFCDMFEYIRPDLNDKTHLFVDSVSESLISKLQKYVTEEQTLVGESEQEPEQVSEEFIKRLKVLVNFLDDKGLFAYKLISNGTFIGGKFKLYYEQIKNELQTIDQDKFVKEWLLLSYMSSDASHNPILFYRENSQEFIGDILAITAIDIKLSKIIDQFNTVYSAYVRGTINA